MNRRINLLDWKPVTVSVASFLLLVFIVTGIGLLGGDHIVRYLKERVMQHGVEHNEEILNGILPLLRHPLENGVAKQDVVSGFQAFIDHAAPFGVRLFLIDSKSRQIIADSDSRSRLPLSLPLNAFWRSGITRLDGESITASAVWNGPAWRETSDGVLELLHLQAVGAEPGSDTPWVLGVASDIGGLSGLMNDLHWHMNAVLLSTYSLIAVLGFMALRRVGRVYESSLEVKVAVRTRALKAADDKLLEKTRLATIGQTASILAHEMRNPLASIKLALSGLANIKTLQDREQRRVKLVLGEVDRLEEMLSETLDYVRPVRLSDEPESLNSLLDKVLQLEEPLLREKRLQLSRRLCPQCPGIRMDRMQLQQVLLNLLKNAVEASPREGEIRLSLRMSDNELVLEMENGGEPMTSDTLERAFEPFFSTKPKGTGLGLGLVKRVTEEHGGTVTIQSNGESGTRVRLGFRPS